MQDSTIFAQDVTNTADRPGSASRIPRAGVKTEAWKAIPIRVKKPTFTPKLRSNAQLREGVPSSAYGQAKVAAKTKTGLTQEEKELKKLGDNCFKPAVALSKTTTAKRDKARGSGYGKEVPKKKLVEPAKPAFAPDSKVTEKTLKKRAKASSSGYGVRTATPKKKSPGPKLTFTPDMKVSNMSAKLRAKAQPKIYSSPRPRTAPPASRTGVVQHEKALRYTLAADRPGTAAPKVEDGPEFVLDCFSVEARNKVNTAPSPEPPSVKARVASKSVTKKAAPTGYGSEWKPDVGTKKETMKAEAPFNVQGGSTYIEDMSKIPSPGRSALQSKRCATVRTHYDGNYSPRKGEKQVVESSEPPIVRPTASDGIPALTPFSEKRLRPNTAEKRIDNNAPEFMRVQEATAGPAVVAEEAVDDEAEEDVAEEAPAAAAEIMVIEHAPEPVADVADVEAVDASAAEEELEAPAVEVPTPAPEGKTYGDEDTEAVAEANDEFHDAAEAGTENL